MRREARTFSIWAAVVPIAGGRYEVRLSGFAVDVEGPEERFTETSTAANLDEAIAARLAMVKAVCERLEKAGSRVSMVSLGRVDPG